jgi:hypothetical protein
MGFALLATRHAVRHPPELQGVQRDRIAADLAESARTANWKSNCAEWTCTILLPRRSAAVPPKTSLVWFIDTACNGESFFDRQAYFTGADQPYEKLKCALRAEVDESAWASLYSTTSRPFNPAKTKKIAVKVINTYGDEVLKAFAV